MSRICCNRANPRELVALQRSLEAVVPLREALCEFRADLLVRARDQGMPDLTELIDLIARTLEDDPPAQISDGGYIRTGYHKDLDEVAGDRIGRTRLGCQLCRQRNARKRVSRR